MHKHRKTRNQHTHNQPDITPAVIAGGAVLSWLALTATAQELRVSIWALVWTLTAAAIWTAAWARLLTTLPRLDDAEWAFAFIQPSASAWFYTAGIWLIFQGAIASWARGSTPFWASGWFFMLIFTTLIGVGLLVVARAREDANARG